MMRFFLTVFFFLSLLPGFSYAQKAGADPAPTGKLYSAMSEDEKTRFVAAESEEILQLFGRTKGDEISPAGLSEIKRFLSGHVTRKNAPKLNSCSASSWIKSDLTSVVRRGSLVSGAIRQEFDAQKLPPALGIYVAMIETEFCPCLQSPTGGLGMYQWLTASGAEYGLKTRRGATSTKPDERCQPNLAARAASKYLKKITDEIFGADAIGFPLAVSAFNRGEGMTKRHIKETTSLLNVERVSFWQLMDSTDEVAAKLEKESAKVPEDERSSPVFIKQFQLENVKYVPKFFAAAIIGENPQAFGINLAPLSRSK
jgi:hypothetical protein